MRRNRLDHATRMRRSFTLIELLVVVAIIAALIAILLPALQSAREMGKRTQCAARQRQLGAALNMYVSGYDDFIPPPRKTYRTSSDTGALDPAHCYASSNYSNWLSVLTEFMPFGTSSQEGRDFWCCPSHPVRSYAYSDYGYRSRPFCYYSSPWNSSMKYRFLKMSKIETYWEDKVTTPSSFWMMVDTTWLYSGRWWQYYIYPYYDSGSSVYAHLRHNQTCNFLFLDGHVETASSPDHAKAIIDDPSYAYIKVQE